MTFFSTIGHIKYCLERPNKQRKKEYSKYTLISISVHINSQWEFIVAIIQMYLSPDIFILIFKRIACLHVS